MGYTIEELKTKMSYKEFAAWVAYDKIERIGDERIDLLLSHICTTLMAVNGHTSSLYDYAHWMDTRTKKEKQREETKKMKADFKSWADQHNASLKAE